MSPGLKVAFRKLAMKWHPDKNPGDQTSEVRFKEINEAYEVLKDPQKRAAYDRFGHAAFEQGMGGGAAHGFGNDFGSAFSDIFEGIFGMAGGRRSGGRERGADLRYNMEITLEEAFSGKTAQVHIPTLDDVRGLFGHGREGRLEAEELRDLRRRRPHPPRAGLLPGGAHLSDLSRPRPDDRGSVHAHARAPAASRASARCR